MERVEQPKKKGLSWQQMLFWGTLFLLAGMVSHSFLQNRVLQMGSLTAMELLEVMSASGSAMAAATAALVLMALETCAIPIFAFLLVEGYEKCRSRKKLLLFLLISALVSEIPYNFVMAGTYLHFESRNPVIAVVIGVVVLYFFHRYSEKSVSNVLIRSVIGIAAVLWSVMLKVDHGAALLVVAMVMWTLREKKQMLTLFGAVASAACVLISPFYIVSPMGILPVHFYREEDPTDMKIGPFLVYPILLLAVGMLSYFI